MESQKKRLEEQLKELSDESRKDDLINFEELGIDSIMVDEAHGFKNLAVFSKMNNVAGIIPDDIAELEDDDMILVVSGWCCKIESMALVME